MSEYYKGKRSKNIYDPASKTPFKISRSRISSFLECPKCFYIDRRLGVDRPPGFPFALNSAVDFLLKKEFDILRKNKQPHALMKEYGINAIPAIHEKLDEWRENFKGVQYHHKTTNFIITGAIDDLWLDDEGKYIVVDYKATSKDEEIKELNKNWQDNYKRQMEIYQWLLRKNGLEVSSTGYFLYCNGKTDIDKFDGKIEFDTTLIAYDGDDSWIESAIRKIYEILQSNKIPPANNNCDYCLYRNEVKSALEEF